MQKSTQERTDFVHSLAHVKKTRSSSSPELPKYGISKKFVWGGYPVNGFCSAVPQKVVHKIACLAARHVEKLRELNIAPTYKLSFKVYRRIYKLNFKTIFKSSFLKNVGGPLTQ